MVAELDKQGVRFLHCGSHGVVRDKEAVSPLRLLIKKHCEIALKMLNVNYATT